MFSQLSSPASSIMGGGGGGGGGVGVADDGSSSSNGHLLLAAMETPSTLKLFLRKAKNKISTVIRGRNLMMMEGEDGENNNAEDKNFQRGASSIELLLLNVELALPALLAARNEKYTSLGHLWTQLSGGKRTVFSFSMMVVEEPSTTSQILEFPMPATANPQDGVPDPPKGLLKALFQNEISDPEASKMVQEQLAMNAKASGYNTPFPFTFGGGGGAGANSGGNLQPMLVAWSCSHPMHQRRVGEVVRGFAQNTRAIPGTKQDPPWVEMRLTGRHAILVDSYAVRLAGEAWPTSWRFEGCVGGRGEAPRWRVLSRYTLSRRGGRKAYVIIKLDKAYLLHKVRLVVLSWSPRDARGSCFSGFEVYGGIVVLGPPAAIIKDVSRSRDSWNLGVAPPGAVLWRNPTAEEIEQLRRRKLEEEEEEEEGSDDDDDGSGKDSSSTSSERNRRRRRRRRRRKERERGKRRGRKGGRNSADGSSPRSSSSSELDYPSSPSSGEEEDEGEERNDAKEKKNSKEQEETWNHHRQRHRSHLRNDDDPTTAEFSQRLVTVYRLPPPNPLNPEPLGVTAAPSSSANQVEEGVSEGGDGYSSSLLLQRRRNHTAAVLSTPLPPPPGLVWFLGSHNGTSSWDHPIRNGELHVSHSSPLTTGCESIALLATPSEGERECVVESEAPGGWIQIDLGPNRSMLVEAYRIRHGRHDDAACLRNWDLRGSNDGITWIVLSEHRGDLALRKPFGTFIWMASKNVAHAFRYVRLVQVDANSSGNFALCASGLDFYGTVVAKHARSGGPFSLPDIPWEATEGGAAATAGIRVNSTAIDEALQAEAAREKLRIQRDAASKMGSFLSLPSTATATALSVATAAAASSASAAAAMAQRKGMQLHHPAANSKLVIPHRAPPIRILGARPSAMEIDIGGNRKKEEEQGMKKESKDESKNGGGEGGSGANAAVSKSTPTAAEIGAGLLGKAGIGGGGSGTIAPKTLPKHVGRVSTREVETLVQLVLNSTDGLISDDDIRIDPDTGLRIVRPVEFSVVDPKGPTTVPELMLAAVTNGGALGGSSANLFAARGGGGGGGGLPSMRGRERSISATARGAVAASGSFNFRQQQAISSSHGSKTSPQKQEEEKDTSTIINRRISKSPPPPIIAAADASGELHHHPILPGRNSRQPSFAHSISDGGAEEVDVLRRENARLRLREIELEQQRYAAAKQEEARKQSQRVQREAVFGVGLTYRHGVAPLKWDPDEQHQGENDEIDDEGLRTDAITGKRVVFFKSKRRKGNSSTDFEIKDKKKNKDKKGRRSSSSSGSSDNDDDDGGDRFPGDSLIVRINAPLHAPRRIRPSVLAALREKKNAKNEVHSDASSEMMGDDAFDAGGWTEVV